MPYAVCFRRLLCFPHTLVPLPGLLTSGLTCGLALREGVARWGTVDEFTLRVPGSWDLRVAAVGRGGPRFEDTNHYGLRPIKGKGSECIPWMLFRLVLRGRLREL